MAIYIAVAFMMIFLEIYNFSKTSRSKEIVEKRICVICALVLITLASLRGDSVGTDTLGYINDYFRLDQYSYQELLSRYRDNPGYYLLSKVFADLGFSVEFWFGFVEMVYISAVYSLISRFSKDKAFSFLMFLILGCYSFSLSGLKQTLAMGIALWAFVCLYNNKNIEYFLLIVLSFFFHKTSVVFLAAFFLMKLKDSKKLFILLTIAFLVFVVAYDQIARRSIIYYDNEHYLSYLDESKSYSATTFIVYLTIFTFSLFFFPKYIKEKYDEAKAVMVMSYLGLITLPLAFSIASAFRISLYFSVFLDLLLPNCLFYIKRARNRLVIKVMIIFILLIYFIYVNRNGGSTVPYVFYWN